jgi:photosynthetic reaction center cytochrome c subunit
MNFQGGFALAILAGLGVALTLTFQHPPVVATQNGYRGLGMTEIDTASHVRSSRASVQIPQSQDPAPAGGPLATTEYKNVQVLKDLSVDQFNRVMLSITEWVAPEQGCAYCHAEGEDLSSDKLFTKVVSRRMLQMTRTINTAWKAHVADTGVTCFTCHRGQPIPANIWYTDAGRPHAANAGNPAGQNQPAASNGHTSLPLDPLTTYLTTVGSSTRVVSAAAFPGTNPHTIKQTEMTYALMVNMSEGLGVNCTYCHNTRSFTSWDQSPPQRAIAYHGIQMVRDLNTNFLTPLQGQFPADRLGPSGDGPKLSCATCHQGMSKPLFGTSMLKDNPEFAGPASPR